ncbi:hypothetical protein KSP39_PZI020898 [Platanthera zijinensis]|uniref:Uncharacterized protein n=1 Tax=Platanthera zijinensis TaxID=2320716 RepID=A0AAP0AZZ1_9ASPA
MVVQLHMSVCFSCSAHLFIFDCSAAHLLSRRVSGYSVAHQHISSLTIPKHPLFLMSLSAGFIELHPSPALSSGTTVPNPSSIFFSFFYCFVFYLILFLQKV